MRNPITLLSAALFGRKYYANIVRQIERPCELASFVFASKEEAARHAYEVSQTRSFSFVETVSFRSRKDYSQPSSRP